MIGGRLGYVLFYDPARYFADPISILRTFDGGMAFHGAVIGICIAIYIFAHRQNIAIALITDLAATSASLGILLGRIANFINGELYGRASDVAWAMVFPYGGNSQRHPSQLYEAAMEGALLLIIMQIATYKYNSLNNRGFNTGLWLILYSILRIFAEFFREADIQIGYFFS